MAADHAAPVRALPPICIASEVWSAGQLGSSILYRASRQGDTLTVGYFVYWSTERPWGPNLLTYSLLPALIVDAFYTHFLFVLPGAQRLIYGPGDVEGVRVVFQDRGDGAWSAVSAVADDGLHRGSPLLPEDFVADDGRLVFSTNVWSHQLGAAGARRFAQAHPEQLRCYGADAISPLTDDIAARFRLGSPADPRRAPPAWK